MTRAWKWLVQIDGRQSYFGNLAILAFLLVQWFDGVFTYLGISWELSSEGNPLIGSLISVAGIGSVVMASKLVAAGFGIILHLLRVHNAVAILTVIYLIFAILPWTYLFLIQ